MKKYLSIIILFFCVGIAYAAPNYKYNSHAGHRDYCNAISDTSETVANDDCQPLRVTDGSFTDEGDYHLINAGASIGGTSQMTSSDTAVSIAHSYTEKIIACDPAFNFGTLADGKEGKIITIEIIDIECADATWTLTPDTATGFTSRTFSRIGEGISLLFVDSTVGWIIISDYDNDLYLNLKDETVNVTGGTFDLFSTGNINIYSVYTTWKTGIGVIIPTALLDVGGGAKDSIDGKDDLLVKDDVEIDDDLFVDGTARISDAYYLPTADGSANDIIVTDGADTLTWKTPTVDTPVVITMYDAIPARSSETNWNGALLELDNAAAVNSGAPFVMTTKGTGKIIIVVNAGGDLVGDITLTGTAVDRNTGVQTGSATSVITLTGATTDGSTTDANGNIVHVFTKAYISDKWFYGVVTITTTDTAITDMDVFHVSFEQLNDMPGITLDTFDINAFVTNASCEFDAYLHTLHVTGDEVNVDNEAELHIGTVGGAKAQPSLANKYYRLRQGNIAEALDGTTDGFWVDIHYSGTPVGIEDVTVKVWFTESLPLTLN